MKDCGLPMLSFDGGLGTQTVMPFGTPEQVMQDVRKRQAEVKQEMQAALEEPGVSVPVQVGHPPQGLRQAAEERAARAARSPPT